MKRTEYLKVRYLNDSHAGVVRMDLLDLEVKGLMTSSWLFKTNIRNKTTFSSSRAQFVLYRLTNRAEIALPIYR